MGKAITDSVSTLKGVGEKTEQALNDLSIFSIYDLLTHYPMRYEDMRVKNIHEVEDKEKIVLSGTVITPPVVHYFAPKRSRLTFQIENKGTTIPVTFFNQPYYKKQIDLESNIEVFGTWDSSRKSLIASRVLSVNSSHTDQDYEPVYPANKNIASHRIRKFIEQALPQYIDEIPELMPSDIQSKYKLMTKKEAVRNIHFPDNPESSRQATRTLKFEEFLVYQLKIQKMRDKERKENEGYLINYNITELKEFIETFPFEPTEAQKRSINEICIDFKRPHRMFRLLQGDVGSGKTIVAAAGMFASFTAGKQSALMAPTEILAEQHFNKLQEIYEPFNLNVALLTGSTPAAQRREILEDAASGKLNILIGTHALIQEDVEFQDLGFSVIDEQHRFGVNQREALSDKGEFTNILFMTATPIPRTLAITSYGEVDMSILDELPAGRKPIETHWVRNSQESGVLSFVHKQVENDSQVYVVSPLIEESENLQAHNVQDIFTHYTQKFGHEYELGLLHGQMNTEEKHHAMEEFQNGSYNILVSTTVIEVGVDVPNASLMVIYDADRFGLAQLHQLRGRVGRGDKASYCILIADPKTEDGRSRMQLMTESNDGFLLSQKDLEMRGPGDYFGSRQSGLPLFKIADIINDYAILEAARVEADEIYHSNAFKFEKDYEYLRDLIKNEEE